eukprot:CAMPEP_0118933646 /NCGR_PEP_ID=MMETSP1169-20130426/12105_1 /TAXON_ID=36882 /ORGANISM="Pyramimonas obovata, Strain CCMP722" /LENGTH=357 /DNA_ID=CAMNT_0006876437 /DNA_START=48 /DNA_END=1121 /DNA_ORIENTATION=-
MNSLLVKQNVIVVRANASSGAEVRHRGLPSAPRAVFETRRALSLAAPARRQRSFGARNTRVRAVNGNEDLIEQMMKEAMASIEENPEQKEALKKMMAEMQEEQAKDPEAFEGKVRQMQEMQAIQVRSFLMQVMMLDEDDAEVGHVVKDLKANGEEAFQKYLSDNKLTTLLQQKCMVKAVVEQLVKIDENDAELGYAVKGYNEQGNTFVEMLLTDPDAMKKITMRAVLDDPYSLHGAVRMNDLETVKFLLENGRDVNAPGPKDLNGAAPLHIASAAGMQQCAQLLLAMGAEVNLATPDTQGNSPLHFAVGYGQIKMISFLLDNGANKYATNANGQMPSEMAELLSDVDQRAEALACLL